MLERWRSTVFSLSDSARATCDAAIAAARTSRSYRIVLIDGARLAALMIEHNLGVSVAQSFALKRLDTDFFGE